MTLAGEVEVERSLYRTERNGATTCPLEQNAGLIESFWMPQAAKHAIHLVSLLTPCEAEHVFKEFGLMTPSKSSLDRLPKKLSDHWEANPSSLDKIIRDDFKIPDAATMCAISLDGVLVPIRYTRVLSSDSRWAEAACGTVSFYDKEGDMLITRYIARMPEHKKKTLKQQLAEHIKNIVELRPNNQGQTTFKLKYYCWASLSLSTNLHLSKTRDATPPSLPVSIPPATLVLPCTSSPLMARGWNLISSILYIQERHGRPERE